MLAWTSSRGLSLLVWSLLFSLSLQQDAFSFVNPPSSESTIPNPVYTVGSPLDIQWVGANDFVSVRLVHYLPNSDLDEFVYVFQNVTNLDGHYTWIIDLGSMNLTISNTFFFNIFVEGETTPRAMTHNVTLTNTTTSTTTSSATTATQTSSTSTSHSIATTSSLPPTTTASSSSTASAAPASSGLSTGAKAGIGVGVAVGAIAILAAGALFWRRHRGGNGTAGGGAADAQARSNYQPVDQNTYSGYYKPQGVPSEPSEAPNQYVSELSGSVSAPHEMADTSRP